MHVFVAKTCLIRASKGEVAAVVMAKANRWWMAVQAGGIPSAPALSSVTGLSGLGRCGKFWSEWLLISFHGHIHMDSVFHGALRRPRACTALQCS